MNRILVTGGAGYIGSHTCKALTAAGYVPVVYDNLVNGHEWAVRWGPFEHGDILDRSRLDEVIAKHQPNAVIHFAALAIVRDSVADPGTYYRNNVAGSLMLFEAMCHHHISRIVFSSSCAVYGIPDKVPITEEAPKRPINPYGMSKMIVERMLADFEGAHSLNWMALRYFNAAGCDPDGEIGEDHHPETHLIPFALEAALNAQNRMTVFGNDYDTPDGTCIRDYIHVSDLADAHVRALAALEKGMAPRAFNLGIGKGFSVLETIKTVKDVTGFDVPFDIGARREGDPTILVSDASAARRILQWSPAIVDLDDIVRTAWNWRRNLGTGAGSGRAKPG